MQKQKKFIGAGLVILAMVVLVSCQNASAPAPQDSKAALDNIKSGIKKLTEVTSFSYDLQLKGDIKDADKSDKFVVALNGGMDLKNSKEPKITVKADGTMTSAGESSSGTFDLRLNSEAVYFNLMKLEIAGMPLPEQATAFIGKPYKYTFPAEVKAELFKDLPAPGQTENLTEQQKKIKALFESTNFFSAPEFLGTDNVKGEQSSHYSVKLDNAALLDFVKQVSELQDGEKVSAEQLADAEAKLKNLDVKGEVWVGSTTGILNKVLLNAVIKDSANPNLSGTVNLELTLSDFGKAVDIDAPKDAQEFPQEMMGFLGGGMSGDSDTLPAGVPEDLSAADLQSQLAVTPVAGAAASAADASANE